MRVRGGWPWELHDLAPGAATTSHEIKIALGREVAIDGALTGVVCVRGLDVS